MAYFDIGPTDISRAAITSTNLKLINYYFYKFSFRPTV